MLGFSCISALSFAQSNTLPTTGNVGIGTTSPSERLTVNGSARIDSTLTVRDSMIVDRDAHIKSDLRVDGKTLLGDDLHASKNVFLEEGNLQIKSLGDTSLPEDGILTIDALGKVKNGGDLKSLLYRSEPATNCATDIHGNLLETAPFWQATANPQRMFLIKTPCSPDPRLGVGVRPDAKFHVRLDLNSQLHPLLIEKTLSSNPSVLPRKLMQLDHTGLLYAREIKVNLDNWADYVFDKNYSLMPLNELQQFINQNKHLPNVPSATEMTTNGLNIAENSKMLMEKVEELTLYVLQINERVKTQEELVKQQQETIRLQQELILQIQQAQQKPVKL
ncbi:hypothetical protein [Fluviicola taffensis]|uniref:Uncharacterized protein n=1 Tax=Fluviicola taffensis (strain DSM 16823 / NCIMB 13979 / RW262) TaxID=755732 RepID=F2IJ30_FLUTR|nr:hypothetical protein [Fluviicola taffensis]AEA43888.1 hypothetical protein Fluta_1901 [Fluviicola taffensis DSM 16823]